MQILWGARQFGKSSLFRRVSEDWAHVTLDERASRQIAQSDSALFLRQYPRPLIIDEVQYAPELLSEIKAVVDELRFV